MEVLEHHNSPLTTRFLCVLSYISPLPADFITLQVCMDTLDHHNSQLWNLKMKSLSIL
jgi:hypothetical protein